MTKKDRDLQILELAKQGVGYEKIGFDFGITKQRVSQIAIKMGVIQRYGSINYFPSKERRNIPLQIRFQILKRDGFTCTYCGKKPPHIRLEVDHIIPKSKKGSDKLENLTTACIECNLGKSNKQL